MAIRAGCSSASQRPTTPVELEPKIIYIVGTILGNQLDDGTLATADTYRATPNPNVYDFDLCVKSFDTVYLAGLQAQADAGDTTAAAQIATIPP